MYSFLWNDRVYRANVGDQLTFGDFQFELKRGGVYGSHQLLYMGRYFVMCAMSHWTYLTSPNGIALSFRKTPTRGTFEYSPYDDNHPSYWNHYTPNANDPTMCADRNGIYLIYPGFTLRDHLWTGSPWPIRLDVEFRCEDPACWHMMASQIDDTGAHLNGRQMTMPLAIHSWDRAILAMPPRAREIFAHERHLRFRPLVRLVLLARLPIEVILQVLEFADLWSGCFPALPLTRDLTLAEELHALELDPTRRTYFEQIDPHTREIGTPRYEYVLPVPRLPVRFSRWESDLVRRMFPYPAQNIHVVETSDGRVATRL